jgi:hypothetical protein
VRVYFLTRPKNWNELRIQWEYSHAVNAVVMFVELSPNFGDGLKDQAAAWA